MNEKRKIVSFKTMKWLFDIILVILVATLALLLLRAAAFPLEART